MAHETDSLIREVEEDLRRERYQRLWDRYGVIVLVGAFAIIAGVSGYKFWQYWSAEQANKAGESYISALTTGREGKQAEAAKILEGFVENGPDGYRTLSRFRLALKTAKDGQTTAAVAAYDKLAGDRGISEVMQGYARIMAAMLLLDRTGWTEIENRLNPLTGSENPWRGTAQELIGLALYKAGELDKAQARFESVMSSVSSTPGLRRRAEMMLSLIVGGGKTEIKPAASDAGKKGAADAVKKDAP